MRFAIYWLTLPISHASILRRKWRPFLSFVKTPGRRGRKPSPRWPPSVPFLICKLDLLIPGDLQTSHFFGQVADAMGQVKIVYRSSICSVKDQRKGDGFRANSFGCFWEKKGEVGWEWRVTSNWSPSPLLLTRMDFLCTKPVCPFNPVLAQIFYFKLPTLLWEN